MKSDLAWTYMIAVLSGKAPQHGQEAAEVIVSTLGTVAAKPRVHRAVDAKY